MQVTIATVASTGLSIAPNFGSENFLKLTRRTREALLDGADDARRSVADDEQGVAEPTRAHVLEEGPHRLGVLLRAGHKVEQNLTAILADAPGGDHGLTRLAST